MPTEILDERKDERGRRQLLVKCPHCGKERWAFVQLTRQKAFTGLCRDCWKSIYLVKGEKNVNWRGGRKVIKTGYVKVRLLPTDFFYPMVAQDGYVLEHRLVVARALGRCLHRWEIVHHKHIKYPAGSAEDKQDNRYPENLQLTMDLPHKASHQMLQRIADLEKRVAILEAENIRLTAIIESEVSCGN